MQKFEFFLRAQLTQEREKNIELKQQLDNARRDHSEKRSLLEGELEALKYKTESLETALRNNGKENMPDKQSLEIENLNLYWKVKSLSSQKALDESKIQRLHTEVLLSQSKIKSLQSELITERDKELYMARNRSMFREEIFNLEEQCKTLQAQNNALLEEKREYIKTIEGLEEDISAMENLYSLEEENQKLLRENQSLKHSLKLSKQAVKRSSTENKELRETSEEVSYNLNRNIEFLERDKKQLVKQIQDLSNENTELSLHISRLEENTFKVKEEIQSEFQQRLLQLRQDKSELEDTVQELRDQLDREPSTESTLFHELALIDVPEPNTNHEEDIIFIQDNKKLNFASRQELIIQITEAENALIKSKIEHAEALTERDIYQKKYLDLKRRFKL